MAWYFLMSCKVLKEIFLSFTCILLVMCILFNFLVIVYFESLSLVEMGAFYECK